MGPEWILSLFLPLGAISAPLLHVWGQPDIPFFQKSCLAIQLLLLANMVFLSHEIELPPQYQCADFGVSLLYHKGLLHGSGLATFTAGPWACAVCVSMLRLACPCSDHRLAPGYRSTGGGMVAGFLYPVHTSSGFTLCATTDICFRGGPWTVLDHADIPVQKGLFFLFQDHPPILGETILALWFLSCSSPYIGSEVGGGEREKDRTERD